MGPVGPYIICMKHLEDIQGSRFYGRRQGKALSEARQGRLDQWLPEIEINLSQADPESPLQGPEVYFSSPQKEYWLEIGFGKGEHLAAQACAHPQVGIIGSEPFLNGVSGLVDLVDQHQLSNVRIFMDDARVLMDSLPDQSLSRAFILFPDPWPKARHHKRRIVSAGNIAVLARLLKDGAELRIGTDHMEYCRWIMAHMLENTDFDWVAETPEDWRRRGPDWPATRYETKSLAQGRKSSYLRFIRRARQA